MNEWMNLFIVDDIFHEDLFPKTDSSGGWNTDVYMLYSCHTLCVVMVQPFQIQLTLIQNILVYFYWMVL